MQSRVSVIMPCYNAEKYLDMSIGSVYEQDYPNIELIVVNDGSVDDSESKIFKWKKKFEEKGFSLIYIYQENQGVGAATNTAVKAVRGDYITLLDSDDRLLQGSVSKRVSFLDDNPDYSGVRSNGWYLKNGNRELIITKDEEKNITDLFTALSLGKTNNWPGTYMIRSDVFFSIYHDKNILPSRFGQKFQMLLPVTYKQKFGYIDEPLMEYYIYENSHSHAKDPIEQYYLSERNSAGWREINFDVVNRLVKDPKEYKKYEDMYNSVYYRGALYRAASNLKKERMIECFEYLKRTGRMNLDDRVVYYSSLKSPKVFFWKILRKGKAILFKK